MVWEFLRPTGPKLVFLAEWTAFILLAWAQGDLPTIHAGLVAAYPLAVFYGIACILAATSRHRSQLARGWPLVAWVAGLVAVDQAAKALVAALLPAGATLPLIPGWLHLTHARNPLGSWVAHVVDLGAPGIVVPLVAVLAICLAAPVCHRYYVATKRPSLWADVAFAGLLAGSISWAWDMALRGYILDFIGLPGVVTADLKDIWLTLGAASFLAEALDNPGVSWRWRGWRAEARAAAGLVIDLVRFARQEWRRKPRDPAGR